MSSIFKHLEAGCLQLNLMSTSAQINQLKYTILYTILYIMPTLRDRLHWLRVPQWIDFKRCFLVFKALHGLAPDYIKNYCVEVSWRPCLRSSSHRHLVIPPPSKTVLFDERSFTVGSPSLWNHLPDNVKEAGSIELFKQILKMHLFRQSFQIPAFS